MTVAYVASPECVSCAVDEGIAILDLRSNTYFSLDPVGADVWNRMVTPVSLDDLTTAIATEYTITPDDCRADIAALLTDMMDHGLVQSV